MPYTEKVVRQAHLFILHGGVSLTMAKIRETHWIPCLRSLVKRVRKSCWGCRRLLAKALEAPPPGNLPATRTQGQTLYQMIGVDFAGPIRYLIRAKTEGKAYLALYACSLMRGVYLDLLATLETDEFLTSLKRFIARRGRPQIIYFDNGGTFRAVAKWLQQVQADEKFHNYLSQQSIKWQFNLSRTPWWGVSLND